MNKLFAEVLEKRDLSKAGELFSLSDEDIKDDITPVLEAISKILDCKDYTQNDNDQSVVEICITRVTTAIRYIFLCSFYCSSCNPCFFFHFKLNEIRMKYLSKILIFQVLSYLCHKNQIVDQAP